MPFARGTGAPPVVAQDRQQPPREHTVAALGALALLDADGHAPAVDGGRAKPYGFGHAEARRGADGEVGAVPGALDAGEETDGLLGAWKDRQGLGPAVNCK